MVCRIIKIVTRRRYVPTVCNMFQLNAWPHILLYMYELLLYLFPLKLLCRAETKTRVGTKIAIEIKIEIGKRTKNEAGIGIERGTGIERRTVRGRERMMSVEMERNTRRRE